MPPLKTVVRPSQGKIGIRVKIKRAEQHIRDLERRLYGLQESTLSTRGWRGNATEVARIHLAKD